MILSTLTVSCCKLCCKIEKISQKMAMSLKNCLSFDDRIFEFNHFSMLKMTGLDSFLSIWSDYLSCFVSLVVVFAYLVILWISCYPLNILSCFEYALVTCIFPLVRSGRPSASLAPASSCSSSTMASSSIVSICSSAITHSFAGSSNVLSIHTNSNTSTHTH